MRFSIEKSVLVVVDIQGNLAHAVENKDILFHHVQALIQVAQHLDIPIIVTEQVPDKLGKTIPEISQYLAYQQPIAKESFSCAMDEEFIEELKTTQRQQIIICGIESHVCILQTVSDLLDHKYQVGVVADAVSSRTEDNNQLALSRMRSMGATLLSTEMIATELLQTSAHPKFKDILSLIK